MLRALRRRAHGPLFWIRLVLVLMFGGVAAAFAGTRLEQRAGVVDIDVVPITAPAGASEPRTRTRVRSRERPSPDVKEQVSYFAHGGPPCESGLGNKPAVRVASRVAIGKQFGICLEGFAENQPVLVTLATPDGRVREHPATSVSSGYYIWSWEPRPGDSEGRYRVRARQGRTVVTGNFRVITAETPFVRLVGSGDPNHYALLLVGGAQPGSRAPVHVYRQWGGVSDDFAYEYFSTVSVPVDQNGNGAARLVPTPGSTVTCYVVETGFGGKSFQPQRCFGYPDE